MNNDWHTLRAHAHALLHQTITELQIFKLMDLPLGPQPPSGSFSVWLMMAPKRQISG
jgi:hypothetical protein